MTVHCNTRTHTRTELPDGQGSSLVVLTFFLVFTQKKNSVNNVVIFCHRDLDLSRAYTSKVLFRIVRTKLLCQKCQRLFLHDHKTLKLWYELSFERNYFWCNNNKIIVHRKCWMNRVLFTKKIFFYMLFVCLLDWALCSFVIRKSSIVVERSKLLTNIIWIQWNPYSSFSSA